MVALMEKMKKTADCEIDEQSVLIRLDLTGLKCPLPVLKVRRQIGQMPVGAILVVMADDPAAPLDFEHFCYTGGHKLRESTENNGVFTIRISKGDG